MAGGVTDVDVSGTKTDSDMEVVAVLVSTEIVIAVIGVRGVMTVVHEVWLVVIVGGADCGVVD